MVVSARGVCGPRARRAVYPPMSVLGVFEEVVDAADEVALEAADRLAVVFPRARCLAM
jgi:hypothetical protein